MFRRINSGEVTIWFEDRELRVQEQVSIAAALLSHEIHTTRAIAGSGAARGPYCMMGSCFECLAIVDGKAGVQTCLTPVREGIRVERQDRNTQIG
jgi:aerobic-type carbon monoxide dehydrogenase small subunit (CoxS/CutS family)